MTAEDVEPVPHDGTEDGNQDEGSEVRLLLFVIGTVLARWAGHP